MVSRMGRRPSVPAAASLACAALALWVSFGALAFIDADLSASSASPVSTISHISYIGLLPPLWWLALLLAAAGLLAIVVRPPARTVAPLWLSAVALLPWLPLQLPLSVFIWTGNVLIWLWTAIAVAIFAPALGRAFRTHAWGPRSALLAGVLSAVAFGLGTWSVAPQHPDGDEPHYLIITQSLLQDRDLKIENNHRQRDYVAYLNRSIKPDFLKRGENGEIYSIHAPGLSLLIAPSFALFGYRGALIELILLSAAGSALVWLLAWRLTGDGTASWFGWAAFALSVPFFFHASALFPDGPGAVLTLVAVLPLLDTRAREPGPLVFVGAALAGLPWLSSRFILLAGTAALVIALRLVAWPSGSAARPGRGVRLAAFAIFPTISAIAFFWFYFGIYGTPNPSVVYGGAPSMSLSAGTLLRGVPGLFFDQQFGLIPNAPVYLCAFAGLVVMLSRGTVRLPPSAFAAAATADKSPLRGVGERRLALELLFISVPYFLVAASFTSWWGGTTPPARYFVPITALLALPAAFWFATVQSVALRTASLGALLVSLLMTATMASVNRGGFVFNFRDGLSRVALWLSPVVDLTKALPSLFQNPPATVLLQTAMWLGALAAAVAVAALFNRRSRTAVILGFGLALELATMAAVSLVWGTNRAAIVTPHAAGPAVLRRYNPDARQIALAYRPFHRLAQRDLPGRIVLARILSTTPDAESATAMTAAHLPAGTYQVTGTAAGAPAGRLRLRTDRVSGPIADWDVASFGTSWAREVTIPIAVAGLQIEADPAARNVLHDVSMRAVSVSPAPRGPLGRQARRAARYGPALVFFLSGEAWMEPAGAWIAGASSARFAIAPDLPSRFQIFVRNGPVENTVVLESPGWQERLMLKPGEERFVSVPPDEAPADRRLMPLRVAATNGFRPADVDPKNEDVRFLGVWIETR
jgi:hypothetical protein